jgi:hypothetical protein
MYSKVDKIVEWLEVKAGRASAVWIALGFMVAAAIYVRPAVNTVALGNLYARMAEYPFTLIDGTYVGYRILTPLLSYFLGFRGQLIIITNLLVAAAVLALVFYYFRSRTPSPGDALYAVAVMAFSLVTLTTIYYGGYTDSMTYLLVFLMWWFRQKRWLFYVLFLLALMNRECVLFLIPWFAYLHVSEASSKKLAVVDLLTGFYLVGSVYIPFRWLVELYGSVVLTTEHYLTPMRHAPLCWFWNSYPQSILGLFTVFKLMWVIPVLAIIGLWRSGRRREVYSMLLLMACVCAQLLIAYDSSRMLTLSFPVVLLGLAYLFQSNAFSFRKWAVPLFLCNLLVPQLYTAAHIVEIMHSTPGNILMLVLGAKEGW